MDSLHNTFLFGNSRIAVAASGRSRYEHTFGGPHDRKGASRKECGGILLHLLHRLDLTDPAIPFAIPGMRWLPLYYCFDFRANEIGYRLISDDAMQVWFPDDDPNVSKDESWPDEDYPREFARSTIKISKYGYDPTDLEDACEWAGVFGISKLSKRDQAAAKRRIADYEEELASPFIQGKPVTPCLNPKCANRNKKGQLIPIALMPSQPVKGIHTFGEWGDGVQLIFRMCPRCYSIRVCNQCD